MKLIRRWSYGLADYLSSSLEESHQKRHVYYYAFQIIFGESFKYLTLFVLAILFGVLHQTLLILTFYAAVRLTAGGYHFKSYTLCMVMSIGIFISLGLVLKYVHFVTNTVIVIFAITFIISIFATIKYSPVDNPNKPITKLSQIKRLKLISVSGVVLWGMISSILLCNGYLYLCFSGCIGVLLGTAFILPLISTLLSKVDIS
jgi:accessory gene regulator B